MTHKLTSCCILLLGLATFSAQSANHLIDHRIEVTLYPDEQTLKVRDQIHLPEASPLEFTLHRGLDPHIITPGATLTKKSLSQHLSIQQKYQLTLPDGTREFVLEYGGKIAHQFRNRQESPGRNQQLLAGTISTEGVFLDAGVAWYPVFADTHQRFHLSVEIPSHWHAVSQGSGPSETTTQEGNKRIVWQESNPQDDIYLIAAPFHLYARTDKPVQAQVYLRQADPSLAERYLDATEYYLELYQTLIGPYPYAKFALVENFWETGYGMPSFTLLGSRVIRLPFILHTSYPHEILHNWWGNGVYIDYQTGNWSEGLTAYLADHLLKEQKGKAIDYRRSALQRFGDFVRSENDFPLIEFRSRHTTASQAVGYDKSLMLFHMLRRKLGDPQFIAGLQHFYTTNRFKTAGFSELRQAFETVSGEKLSDFFEQWTQRTGAPALEISELEVDEIEKGYRLSGVIVQSQKDKPFNLDIPMHVYLAGTEQPVSFNLTMDGRTAPFSIDLPDKPLRLDVDPWFDLFRQLQTDEAPPTLGKLLGAERVLFVLPSKAPAARLAAYRQLAEAWGKGYEDVSIVLDRELKMLPRETASWLLGWENNFLDDFLTQLDTSRFSKQKGTIQVAGARFTRSGHSLVLVDSDRTSGGLSAMIACDDPNALAGLSRKVPHYGKYSYLVFAGENPDNQLKGQWPVTESPLRIYLSEHRPAIQPLHPVPLWPSPAGNNR